MRLLRADALLFEEFIGEDILEYAILSHCWEQEQDELSYQDMCRVIKHSSTTLGTGHIRGKRGFYKIRSFRRKALEDGYKYVWADTCCIDKSSSAELQEAINSMYQW